MTRPAIALTEPSGPPRRPLLVLGHSLGTGPLIWENAAPLLAREYRVSLLALPGHGAAPVPAAPFSMEELSDAVAEGVRSISDGPAFYAGVSIGGALALELALRHGELFAAVASVASGAELGGREHWEARAELVRSQSTASLVRQSAEVWFAPDSIAAEPVLTGRILRVLQETSAEGYARCAEALGGYDVRSRLAEIGIPVLAAWGEHDTVAPEAKQDEIVVGVNSGGAELARKARIDGVAHQPPAERPGATADVLLEFFGGIGR
ncbi:alpha/beta fold hydrolase [Leucobacter weissii]|uniref:Alpha/beta fold hydrolase n=1 Tax=Leucobacter weissii TaxID=1983706 RepID=A0A939MGY5_9MICO|nr:alpha/beta fold hydrolase [Leucobacter weissii]MBO1900421.1 alpha/beta fold hydrolase [Leucobacter weissii]